MLKIGEYNDLVVVRHTPYGLLLAGDDAEVLLPRKYSPDNVGPGEVIRVFVLRDSEDRVVATTQRPKAVVGQFAVLEAKEATPVGTFMDWGLDKDLLVPFREERSPMQVGRRYVVRVMLDEKTRRVIGTRRLMRFLESAEGALEEGAEVSFLVHEVRSDGVMVIVDDRFAGMLFRNEMPRPLQVGDRGHAYVRRIRTDGRVDLSPEKAGYEAVLDHAPALLDLLKRRGGFLPFNDQTPPDVIRREFGISKGLFKKAIGNLLRSEQIDLTDRGILLRKSKSRD